MIFHQFLAVVRAFEHERVEYVLVGGVAVNIHGIVRTTEDVDFVVRPSDANVGRLRAALRSLWNDPHIDAITAADLGDTCATVRYGPPTGDIVIDLLSGIGTTWRFDDLESAVMEFGGARVRVATPATLVRMKSHTMRARDQTDAALLRERFDLKDDDNHAR